MNTVVSKAQNGFVKNQHNPIAFVLGTTGTGLGVIRSLGRRSIPVIGIDSNPWQIGRFSRYCKGLVCPDPAQQREAYIEFLIILGKLLTKKGVLIPSADTDVLAISEYRDVLSEYYEVPLAKLDVVEKLINKRMFYRTLGELDMPHPKTYFPSSISDVLQIGKSIHYPCIIKLALSCERRSEGKVFIANCGDELVKSYKQATSGNREAVIQEVIPGRDTNMYLAGAYFNKLSKPLGICTFRRIRQYPRGFGNGALCESVWVPEIAELCTSFLTAIGYHGIIDAEFKRDPGDNKFKFIEINARVGWQNRLAARCGIDLPYMAYMDALGLQVEEVPVQKNGVKWWYFPHDLRSAFESIVRSELSVLAYLRSLKGEKEYAVFAWNDPIPSLVLTFSLVVSTLKYLLRRAFSWAKVGDKS